MAHFIRLFGAVEGAQNALCCKNGLGDRQVGKLTTATGQTLVNLSCVKKFVYPNVAYRQNSFLQYSPILMTNGG